LIFLLPRDAEFLTNSRPTAYDSEGNCVPLYVLSFMYVKQNGEYAPIRRDCCGAIIPEQVQSIRSNDEERKEEEDEESQGLFKVLKIDREVILD